MSDPKPGGIPTDCWYALADVTDVGSHLLAVRALERPVLLFRRPNGEVAALEDRCAHRAYPLSSGQLNGDRVRCGLCGFVYDYDGQCVEVPTQQRVPFGAQVPSFPVHEADGLVWVWLGERGRARLHRVPNLPWLADAGWSSIGGSAEVAAGFLLLLESFADVTQVPYVAPEVSPAVLSALPPPLEVVVTETTVMLQRKFPPAPLPPWQAAMAGVDPERMFATDQQGIFHSPGAWVDNWDVSEVDTVLRLRFTQLVTPIDRQRTRLNWRVSRDFAVDDSTADTQLAQIFAYYYGRVTTAMETAQQVWNQDGPGPEVNVAADLAALKVREIVGSMLIEEGNAIGPRRVRP